MPLAETLAVLMVVAVCVLLFAGYPVALTLGGVSLGFAVLGHVAGAMNLAFLGALPQRVYGVMTNDVLLAIPMFVFMGVMLERSRIAEELLETMGRLFGSLRGGLGFSVCIVGAMLAASTGIVGATAVTMGLIVLPAMITQRLRQARSPRLRRWPRSSRHPPCWCCSATSCRAPTRRRSLRRAISRRRPSR
jgi:TRAP-type mannitol/chloroaromatic compound transport system permease large subunit